MGIDIESIAEQSRRAKRNNMTIAALKCENKELLKPVFTNVSLIPEMYSLFKTLMEGRKSNKGVYDRNKFLLIVICLFSPETLSGYKMKPGVRDIVSRCFGVKAKTTISDNARDVLFLYTHYLDFKEDVDYLCREMVIRFTSDSFL